MAHERKQMKQLYFIRHGQSELNLLGIVTGSIDSPLTDTGRLQAKLAAADIKNLGVDLIVTSNLSRARETAKIIAIVFGYNASDVISDELFTVQACGSFEGMVCATPPCLVDCPGAETDDQLMLRARKGLDYLKTLQADTILLVSHGAYSRALRATVHSEAITAEEPDNAKVVQFI